MLHRWSCSFDVSFVAQCNLCKACGEVDSAMRSLCASTYSQFGSFSRVFRSDFPNFHPFGGFLPNFIAEQEDLRTCASALSQVQGRRRTPPSLFKTTARTMKFLIPLLSGAGAIWFWQDCRFCAFGLLGFALLTLVPTLFPGKKKSLKGEVVLITGGLSGAAMVFFQFLQAAVNWEV